MLSSADVMKLEFFLPRSDAARARLLSDKFRLATLMRAPVITVSEHESVERAAELMASNAVHSLPVVNTQGHLIGIITTTDIIAAFLRSLGSTTVTASGQGASDAAGSTCTVQRLAALEHVAREARRYVNAGQDERLHAQLMKAIERLGLISDSRSGQAEPVLGSNPRPTTA
jgi:hypothetical protein